MNNQKLDLQERFQDFEQSPQFFRIHQQPWSMRTTQHQNPDHVRSSSTILDRFESPASAFYATERYMGFNSSEFSRTCDSQQFQNFPGEIFSVVSAEQAQPLEIPWKFYKSPEASCIDPLEKQDHRVSNDGYGLTPNSQLSYTPYQEKQSPRFSSSSCVSTGPVIATKTRIRWTQDLHEKFVECVNCLGGADRRSEKSSLNDLPQIDIKPTLQIREALQVQLDVQRRLHEQLEIQRNLQLRIEEQGKRLKMLFDQQLKTNKTHLKPRTLEIVPEDDPPFNLEEIEVSIAEN